MEFSRGNFIDNEWLKPEGFGAIRSVNPATADEVVLEAPTDPKHAALAVQAAARAWPAWAALPSEERIAALRRFARELAPRTEALARAITQEMGKTIREARQEASSLIQRVDLVAEQQLPLVRPWGANDVPGECRYHPLGVIAVLGPFNAPLQVCHAHIMPALATGNCVVVKPSERTPLAFQRYMEAWAAAGLPPVLNMIQGGPEVGKALLRAPDLRGVAFTGSWRSGHAIQKALLDRPEVLAALEMGGQNMAIVLEDADLDQALEGVLLGGFLTTGQRCTGTSRVLVAKTIADAFIARLVRAAERLTFGDPTTDVFMGPMASCGDRDRLEALCRAGREAGAEVLLAPVHRDGRDGLRDDLKEGGAWRGPSIHQITKQHDSDYTREEVFGPDLAVTVVDGLDDALEVVRASPFGLSVAIFSARRAAFEAVYLHTHVGCVNWNRSTNRASGMMPFGGVGKSGNYRAAGSDVVRYATYPVQVQWNEPGVLENDPFARAALHAADPVMALETVHRMEEALEPYGLYPEFDSEHAPAFRIPLAQLDTQVTLSRPLADGLRARGVPAEVTETAVRVPMPSGEHAARLLARHLSDALYGIRQLHPARFLSRRPAGCHVPAASGGADPRLALPRSQSFMKRLIAGGFIADDPKPQVLDLVRSSGPYLASVDDDPLVLFDGASQIGTHAAGINPPAVVDALWLGRFAATPIDNGPSGAGEPPETQRLASYLREATATAHSPALPHVRFSNSGAEANEIALATAAVQRPGRRAIVAFRGAFHGRTRLAGQATWSRDGGARDGLAGSQARWLDVPVWASPLVPAPEPDGWLTEWRKPAAERSHVAAWLGASEAGDHDLLAAEIAALTALEAALADDQVVAVLIEPMQAEAGERYVTPRFMRAARAITAWLGVPLIIDEVETGFHLGGPFFWHTRFDLPSPPDIVTVAKKAQLGATLSRWPIPVRAEIAAASAVRGALFAEILATASPDALMAEVGRRLCELTGKHPKTVLNPRVTGWSFGFDLPSPEALAHVIAQRLWRGYVLYPAGERSLSFRLHPEVTATHVEALFQRLGESLNDAATGVTGEPGEKGAWRDDATTALVDRAPAWPAPPAKLRAGYRLVRIPAADWPAIRGPYETMHNASADAPSALDFERMSALVQEPDAICLAVVQGKPSPQLPPKGTLVGAAIGFAIEHVSELDGPRQDATLGDGATFFVADVTVHAEHRGFGLGRALKESLIAHAMGAKKPTGEARFAFMTGRRPVSPVAVTVVPALATAPRRDADYGAYHVGHYAGMGSADAFDYYRIALTAPRLPPRAVVMAYPGGSGPSVVDWDSGLERRLGDVRGAGAGVDELREHLAEGQLNGAIVNKLSLANFVTPAIARAYEVLRLSAPRALPHMVVASGRAEALDKTLRALESHRAKGRIVASLGPVRAGMATAAARSVTLSEKDEQNWYGWPTLADPTRDPERALVELKKLIADRGAAQVLAVVIEPVFLATGRAVPEAFWGPLRALLDEHDIPLCLIETTTAGYRNGRSFWRADSLPTPVDAVVWWPGGQLGCGFVADRYSLARSADVAADKRALTSTWDGDEVSLTRLMWELRTARTLPIAQRSDALRKALAGLAGLAGAGAEISGEGLYLTVEHPQAEALQRRLFERGFRVGLTETKALRIVPPLNVTAEDIARFAQIAREVLG